MPAGTPFFVCGDGMEGTQGPRPEVRRARRGQEDRTKTHIVRPAPPSRSRGLAGSSKVIRRGQDPSGASPTIPRPTVVGPMIRLTLFR